MTFPISPLTDADRARNLQASIDLSWTSILLNRKRTPRTAMTHPCDEVDMPEPFTYGEEPQVREPRPPSPAPPPDPH